MSNDQVTSAVIEMEPGWVDVETAVPKPEPDFIESLLRRTMDNVSHEGNSNIRPRARRA
jgi:hypothetical protein